MIANYQVEYQLNGVPNSFEFYLFVNPLGLKCYKSEQELIHSLDVISSKVDVHILTFHNQQTIDHFLEQIHKTDCTLEERNEMYHLIYQAALAYKAASLQGRKLGRRFLIRIQEAFHHHHHTFNQREVITIAKEIGLDLEIFMKDLRSDFVKQLFLRDQQIAREMQVDRTPSLVIFQNQSSDDGILIREHITKEKIIQELDLIVENYHHTRTCPSEDQPQLSIIHHSDK